MAVPTPAASTPAAAAWSAPAGPAATAWSAPSELGTPFALLRLLKPRLDFLDLGAKFLQLSLQLLYRVRGAIAWCPLGQRGPRGEEHAHQAENGHRGKHRGG